jgi:hypothetical protein
MNYAIAYLLLACAAAAAIWSAAYSPSAIARACVFVFALFAIFSVSEKFV